MTSTNSKLAVARDIVTPLDLDDLEQVLPDQLTLLAVRQFRSSRDFCPDSLFRNNQSQRDSRFFVEQKNEFFLRTTS
jgi:hypothetical protein